MTVTIAKYDDVYPVEVPEALTDREYAGRLINNLGANNVFIDGVPMTEIMAEEERAAAEAAKAEAEAKAAAEAAAAGGDGSVPDPAGA